MDDPRVTRALRLLLDHDDLIKSWAEVQYGRGAYGSVFPTALSAWDLTPDEYRTHLEWKQPKDEAAKEALSLLSAAGYTKDKPLRFEFLAGTSNPAIVPAIQLIQAQWKRLSQGVVDAQLQFVDGPAGQARLANRQFTFDLIGTSTGVVDPDSWLTAMFHSDGSLNYTGWSDPQADAMIDKQRTIFDETQRKAAVKEIVLYLIDHAASTITANRFFLQGLKPQVQNHVPEYFLNGRQYQTVWLSS
jgi:ABC-type transport system substrate-binding protein